MLQDSYEDYELADSSFEDALEDEDLEWFDDSADLSEVLGEALRDDYFDAGPDELDDALANVLESMSPAEAFNFTKALKQIGQGARKAVSDPAVSQIVRSAVPVAGGALGTVIGGPVGTALGSKLGNAAAGAVSGATPAPALKLAAPAVAGGSAAAAQGLVLTQQPDVLQSLLALAMGQHGQKSVNGVPVASIMNMLSSVFGQAAADADELMYLDQEELDDHGEALADDAGLPTGRPLYTTLMDAENAELAEAVESL